MVFVNNRLRIMVTDDVSTMNDYHGAIYVIHLRTDGLSEIFSLKRILADVQIGVRKNYKGLIIIRLTLVLNAIIKVIGVLAA